jgi:mRNA-degrading endonuclease YafQ of YafQ-DinJ toxin-antitoxin module
VRFSASSQFLRRAKKLKDPHAAMLRAALRRFAANPRDPLLRTHRLKFSVDEDLRVVFRWDGDEAFLVNIGSHHEVY